MSQPPPSAGAVEPITEWEEKNETGILELGEEPEQGSQDHQRQASANGMDDFPPLVAGQPAHAAWIGGYVGHMHKYVKVVNRRNTSIHVKARGYEKRTLQEWELALAPPTPAGPAELRAKGVYVTRDPPDFHNGLIQKAGTRVGGFKLDRAIIPTDGFDFCLVELREGDKNGPQIGVDSIPARSMLITFPGDNV